MSFDGTVTMVLRVVAPETFVPTDGFFRRPPNLTYFLLASPNLETRFILRVVGL